VISAAQADALLADWRRLPQGDEAAVIGVVNAQTDKVLLATELGGERMLDELEDDPLPRIC